MVVVVWRLWCGGCVVAVVAWGFDCNDISGGGGGGGGGGGSFEGCLREF